MRKWPGQMDSNLVPLEPKPDLLRYFFADLRSRSAKKYPKRWGLSAKGRLVFIINRLITLDFCYLCNNTLLDYSFQKLPEKNK